MHTVEQKNFVLDRAVSKAGWRLVPALIVMYMASGKLTAAAIDVYEVEPVSAGNPLSRKQDGRMSGSSSLPVTGYPAAPLRRLTFLFWTLS